MKKKFLVFFLILFSATYVFGFNAKNQDVVLKKSGIEGIDNYTKFKKLSIKRIFQKSNIVDSKISSEGEDYPIILVKNKSETILIIKPKERDRLKVGKVEIVSRNIDSEFDFNIGDKYSNIFGQKKIKCYKGVEENSDKIYCEDSDLKDFSFEFSGDMGGVEVDKLPSRNALRKWTLTKIIWNIEK